MNAKKNMMEEITLHPDYASRISEVVRSNLTPKHIGDRVADFHENDIAAALELLKKRNVPSCTACWIPKCWPMCWPIPKTEATIWEK